MMENLPSRLEKNEPVISTLDIADGVEAKYVTVFKLVRKFETELKSIRNFDILNVINKKKGRPVSYCFLNEEQSIFLVTLMRNFPKVVQFKKRLSKDFIKMRNQLAEITIHQKEAAWVSQRNSGKLIHKEKTDIIKDFVEYSISQGGSIKGCKMYYSNFATMENKALFILEQQFKNFRDILNLNQLATITSADGIAKKAIREGMGANLYYKDIYKLAKKRVETFADLHGKTLIPTTQQHRIGA